MSSAAGQRHFRALILLLGAGLVTMLITAMVMRLINPKLTVHAPAVESTDMGGGMTEGWDAEIARLMREAAENPNDLPTLLRLTDTLMHAERWDAAEQFAKRAVTLNLNDPQALFLLGIIRHNQGKHREAADTLEKVLPLRDDAPLRYSLGILYLHYLNDPDRGYMHFRAAIADPNIDPDLKKSIGEELNRAKAGKPSTAAPAQPKDNKGRGN